MMRIRHLLLAVLIAPLMLTGCQDLSRDDPKAPTDTGIKPVEILAQHRGVGEVVRGDQKPFDGKSVIYRLDGTGSRVVLTTYGSGSCPRIPTTLQLTSPTRVKLTLKTYSGACTADLAPYTSEFELPHQVSRRQAVRFILQTPGVATAEQTVLSPVANN